MSNHVPLAESGLSTSLRGERRCSSTFLDLRALDNIIVQIGYILPHSTILVICPSTTLPLAYGDDLPLIIITVSVIIVPIVASTQSLKGSMRLLGSCMRIS